MSLEAFDYEQEMADFMDDENHLVAPAENELNEYDMVFYIAFFLYHFFRWDTMSFFRFLFLIILLQAADEGD